MKNKKILKQVILKSYLYPEKGDLFIKDIQISTRLCNALARNGIFLVSQLGNYPKESYLAMRNIGEKSYKELEGIFKRHRVNIPTLDFLAKDLLPVLFSTRQLLELYENNIHLAKDIENFSMEQLKVEYGYNKRLFNNICKVIKEKKLDVRLY